jgi:hypothetical protein
MTLGLILKDLRNNNETSNAGNKWTIEEDNKLLAEIEEISEKSYEEIALEHKRTVLSIKSRVITHIILPKYKDIIGNENEVEKIANDYKLEKELIIKYCNKIIINGSIKESIKENKINNYTTTTNKIFEYLQELDSKINDINTKIDKLLNL